jgi:hypothetical protein
MVADEPKADKPRDSGGGMDVVGGWVSSDSIYNDLSLVAAGRASSGASTDPVPKGRLGRLSIGA